MFHSPRYRADQREIPPSTAPGRARSGRRTRCPHQTERSPDDLRLRERCTSQRHRPGPLERRAPPTGRRNRTPDRSRNEFRKAHRHRLDAYSRPEVRCPAKCDRTRPGAIPGTATNGTSGSAPGARAHHRSGRPRRPAPIPRPPPTRAPARRHGRPRRRPCTAVTSKILRRSASVPADTTSHRRRPGAGPATRTCCATPDGEPLAKPAGAPSYSRPDRPPPGDRVIVLRNSHDPGVDGRTDQCESDHATRRRIAPGRICQ